MSQTRKLVAKGVVTGVIGLIALAAVLIYAGVLRLDWRGARASDAATGVAAIGTPLPLSESAAVPWQNEEVLRFAAALYGEHLKRWEQYRKLDVTRISGDEQFREVLTSALRTRVKPATDSSATPPTSADAARLPALADLVHEVLLSLGGRDFAQHKEGLLRNRRIKFVDREPNELRDGVKFWLDMDIEGDPDALPAEEKERIVRAYYELRRDFRQGAHHVVAVGLGEDTLDGLYYRVKDYLQVTEVPDLVLNRIEAEDHQRAYFWRGSAAQAAFPVTVPVNSFESAAKRPNGALWAVMQTIVETANEDRFTVAITAWYDEQLGQWQIATMAWYSSPVFISTPPFPL